MVRIQVTKVIYSKNTGTTAKILITVVSLQAGHGVKPTAIYQVI